MADIAAARGNLPSAGWMLEPAWILWRHSLRPSARVHGAPRCLPVFFLSLCCQIRLRQCCQFRRVQATLTEAQSSPTEGGARGLWIVVMNQSSSSSQRFCRSCECVRAWNLSWNVSQDWVHAAAQWSFERCSCVGHFKPQNCFSKTLIIFTIYAAVVAEPDFFRLALGPLSRRKKSSPLT
jgi:hypothetical protein